MKKLLAPAIAALALSACMTPYGQDRNDPYGPTGQYPSYPGDGAYGQDYGAERPRMANFRATGTEPFWSLEISDREMIFTNADGYRLSQPTPQAQVSPEREIYTGERMRVVLERRECRNQMSNAVSPYITTVVIGAQTYRGCGGAERVGMSQDPYARPPAGQQGYQQPGYGNQGYQQGYQQESEFARTNWRVTEINNRRVAPGSYYMNFTPDGVSAKFGCNIFNGNVRQDGRTLSIGPVTSTRMNCPDMNPEYDAQRTLQQPLNIDRQGDRLVLSNPAGSFTLTRSY